MQGEIDWFFDIARRGHKASDLLTDLMDKTIPKQYREQLCLVWCAHSVILSRDVNKVIKDDLLARAKDFDKFNNDPYGYDSLYLTIQYLLTNLSSETTTLYVFPWAFMAWPFEVIPLLRKKIMDYSDKVFHPRMFRWLVAKSNTIIKEISHPMPTVVMDYPSYANWCNRWIIYCCESMDRAYSAGVGDDFLYYSRSFDTIADSTMELTKKESAEATAIRRAFRQGYPRFKALHDQPTKADLGASSGGVFGIGSRHADATTTRDDKHVDAQENLMRKRQLLYPKDDYATDRIIDLEFYKKLKDRYVQLNTDVLAYGAGLDFVVSALDLEEEEMIKYGRGKRPNLHGKRLTEAKRNLAVISVNGIHYWTIEILLEEGKIKVYDCNEPAINEVDLFFLV
ncbi:hypothetical protein FXO38_15775 [Capsicum annuum]|nr:hypothetical protein FXO38_15775 [Capsicum annuum]